MSDDDIQKKAERVLRQMAVVAEKHGGLNALIDITTQDFVTAVGMTTYHEVFKVMPVLTQKGFATKVTKIKFALTNAGLEASKDTPPKPRVGTRVVNLDLAFVTDIPLREVLERNAEELQKALDAGAWTCAIVMAGAITEGVLYFVHSKQNVAALGAVAAVQMRTGKTLKPFDRWDLWTYIEIAEELGYFTGTTKKLVHDVLRDFRNMVHPKVQLDKKLTPSETAADGSVVYLKAVVADIAAEMKKP